MEVESKKKEGMTAEELLRVIPSNLVYFLTLNDVKTLTRAFTLAWMRLAFPDAIWRRFVYLRVSDSYITLFPPPVGRTPKNWLAYILLSKPWKFTVEILEHTLLGYNFVFDETKRMKYYELACARASLCGLPDFDLQGKRVFVSGRSNQFESTRSFVASYSSFAVKTAIVDGLGRARDTSLALCVMTHGGMNAIILTPGLDWKRAAMTWINKCDSANLLVIVRKVAMSTYEIDRVLAKVAS